MHIPFSYLVTHLPSGLRYYGARWAQGCHPKDLWTTYFTSSKTVKELLERDGPEAFSCEVRRTFSTRKKCEDWEQKVLTRLGIPRNPKWLNRAVGAPPGFKGDEAHRLKLVTAQTGKKLSEETKRKMSEIRKGKPSGREGKLHSEETKSKIAAGSRGRIHSEETKRKIAVGVSRARAS